ncbi:MAG: protein kinase, partial [Chloroflexota bacterium]
PTVEQQAARQRLDRAIQHLFQQTAQPILLILEDLQWTAESLEVLKQLIKLAPTLPLLIVGNYRNDEKPELPEALPQMKVITLERLSAKNIKTLSEAMLGDVGHHPEIVDQLLRETEGNAFFLVEIVRALAEDVGGLGNIDVTAFSKSVIPQGIQAIIERRLARIPSSAQPLLKLATIAGRRLDLQIMHYLAGEKDITEWLSICTEASILAIQDNHWQFIHDKIREGIINNIDPDEQKNCHKSVAEAINTVYPDDPSQAATLAYHWRQAGDPEQELHYALTAGQHAVNQYANKDAAIFFSQAYRLLPEEALSERFECLRQREIVYGLLAQRDQQQQDINQLQKLATQMGDPIRQVEVSLQQLRYKISMGEDYETVLETLPAILAHIQSIGNNRQIADGYLLWGEILARRGEFIFAKQQGLQAYKIAQTADDEQLTLRSLQQLGTATWFQGDRQTAETYFQQGLVLARKIKNLQSEGHILNSLGIITALSNLYSQAVVYGRQSVEIAQQISNRAEEDRGLNNLGWIYMMAGHFSMAKTYFEQSLQVNQDVADPRAKGFTYRNLATIAYHEDQDDEMQFYVEQGLILARQAGDQRLEMLLQYWQARLREKQGNYLQAKKLYQNTLDIADVLQQQENRILILSGLLRIATREGQTAVRDYLNELLPQLKTDRFADIDNFLIAYLSCYQAAKSLRAFQTETLLTEAYQLVKATEKNITDSEMRQAYLESRFENREILRLYREGQTSLPIRSNETLTDDLVTVEGNPARQVEQPSPSNRYILHESLGQGGMGVVHRTTDRLTGDMVALKQIKIPAEQLQFMTRVDTETKQNLRLSLAREFQILAGLRHPHIISVLDYGFDTQQMPFFTMTYLPEAETFLEAGLGLDTHSKIELLRQLLQALAYLHRRGIIHRDIKPRNVLVYEKRVQVLDFGLSFEQKAGLSSAGGTLLYMAPEIVLQGQPASFASDLYAAGVMAYELFAGHHPFDVKSKTFTQELRNNTPDLSLLGVDKKLAAIVGRLLEKKPEDRFNGRVDETLKTLRLALGEAVSQENVDIRESYLQAATFVGRQAELNQLSQVLKEVKAGPAQVWLLGGESGVGKSRLLDEFRVRALVSGWQVLTGQAAAEGGVDDQLWQTIVPQLALNTELSDLEAGVLKQMVPTIAQLFPKPIPAPPELIGAAYRDRQVLTLVAILQRQTQPTLLILEDLHWAEESLAPVKQILKLLSQLTGVLVVGTYRNDEHPNLPEVLPDAQILPLDRLNEAEVAQLTQSMVGKANTTTELVALLSQQSEGNTFFMVEANAGFGGRGRTFRDCRERILTD